MASQHSQSALKRFVFDRRAKWALVVLMVGYVITIIFTGGIYIFTGKTYDRFPISESFEGEGYFPTHSYVSYKRETAMILPFLLYWERLDFPATLVIFRTDPTYLERDKPYSMYILDRMELVYEDGQSVALIDSDAPVSDRTFDVDQKLGNFVFDKVITRKQSFVLHVSGQSVNHNGKVEAFTFKKDFTIQSLFEWTTVWDIIASC